MSSARNGAAVISKESRPSSSCFSNSSSSTSNLPSTSLNERRSRKKDLKSIKKEIRKTKKRLKKQRRKEKKKLKKLKKTLDNAGKTNTFTQAEEAEAVGPSLEMVVAASKARAPMTREEWDKLQSRVTKVIDPDTGRQRLIKGTGEVLEECVSRARHDAINKNATVADGQSFQAELQRLIKE